MSEISVELSTSTVEVELTMSGAVAPVLIDVIAPFDVVAGQPLLTRGFAGMVVSDALMGETTQLEITPRVYDFQLDLESTTFLDESVRPGSGPMVQGRIFYISALGQKVGDSGWIDFFPSEEFPGEFDQASGVAIGKAVTASDELGNFRGIFTWSVAQGLEAY